MIQLLYVEDELLLARIVKETLESRGFAVTLVGEGNGVLPALERAAFDLCILDVMLPHVDGFTLAERIRTRYPQLPIIFLTAKVQSGDVLRGFQSGGNDYLRKPFSMEELIARIHNLLHLTRQGNGAAVSPALQLGQYTFYPDRYELRLGGQVRQLSFREAQLLRIFIDHRNQTVPRRQILLEVWGDDSFFNSRNLDVYVRKIRDYLKDDPAIRILTLKGVGYQVVEEERGVRREE